MAGYVWRDPARVTESRRAELAAHDQPVRPRALPGLTARRREQFTELRNCGYPVWLAAIETGVCQGTGRAYERWRRLAQQEAEAG